MLKTKNGKPFVLSKLLSKCAVCGSRKLRFIKEQAEGLLSSLGLKIPLSNIPLILQIYSI